MDQIKRVSIPIGFSNELQLRFQNRSDLAAGSVSIPIGFSNELQLVYPALPARRDTVSIPIGFSNELQPQRGVQPDAEEPSFNPYRVFQ